MERILEVIIRDLGENHSGTTDAITDSGVTYWNQGRG